MMGSVTTFGACSRSTVRFQGAADVQKVSTPQAFATALQDALPVVVKFSAPWCGPCKAIQPYFESKAGQFQGKAKFVDVSIGDANNPNNADMEAIAAKYSVRAVPTYFLFKGGQATHTITGGGTKALDSILNAI